MNTLVLSTFAVKVLIMLPLLVLLVLLLLLLFQVMAIVIVQAFRHGSRRRGT